MGLMDAELGRMKEGLDEYWMRWIDGLVGWKLNKVE